MSTNYGQPSTTDTIIKVAEWIAKKIIERRRRK